MHEETPSCALGRHGEVSMAENQIRCAASFPGRAPTNLAVPARPVLPPALAARGLLFFPCVSVAAKMEEYRAPALSEFDAAGGYEFCSTSILQMELLVLSTLSWRMGAVTPIDYLPCFSSRLHRHGGGGGGHDAARVALKAIGFIFATAEAGSVLDYMPSTVAAAAILAASYGGLLTKEALESKMTNLFPTCLIEKEHVHACYSMMVGDLNRRSNKRSLPCSGSNEVATSSLSHCHRWHWQSCWIGLVWFVRGR